MRLSKLFKVPGAAKTESAEASNTEFARDLYLGILRREPDPEGWRAHVEALNSGIIDRRGLIEAFVASDEFRARTDLEFDFSSLQRRNYFMTELADGSRFWIRLNDEGVSRGIIEGSYEEAETAFVRRQVKPGMNVLDIGANLGWYTVQMGWLVGSAGRVTAFEPRADIFHYLSKTVQENRLTNVLLQNCALAARTGKADLFWHKTDECPGWSQLVPTSLDRDKLSEGYTIETVTMRLLDDLLDKRLVDFVKIDVEGAEKLVFDGAARLLRKDRPLILSEVNATDLLLVSQISAADYLGYLATYGYVARLLEPGGTCGRIIRDGMIEWHDDLVLNIAFVPSEKECC